MVAALRSWRLRSRLFFAWLITRHPRFKPLYHSDVVSYDTLEQACFLADAGYYVAGAMMARNYIEHRFKRVCVLSPQWRSLTGKAKFSYYVGFLKTHGWIGPNIANRADRFYSMASSLVHGEGVTYARCHRVIEEAFALSKNMDNATDKILRADKKATSQVIGWPSLAGEVQA